MAEGHKASNQQILLASFSLTLIGMLVLKQFKLNFPSSLQSKIFLIKGNSCCFTNCVRKLYHWPKLSCSWTSLVQTWYGDRYYWLLRHNTSLSDLDLCLRSEGCKKPNTSSQLSRKLFNWLGWNLVCYWDLLVQWTLFSLYLIHFMSKGENSTYATFGGGGGGGGGDLAFGLHWDIYRPMSL